MHGRITKGPGASRLTPQQIRAMQQRGPTPNDILENEGFARELHEEIEQTYDVDDALVYAIEHDSSILESRTGHLVDNYDELGEPEHEAPVPIKETPVSNELDLPDEEELERQLAEARARRQAREAAEREAVETEDAEGTVDEMDPEAQRVAAIRAVLNKMPGAPNDKQIQQMKRKYGDSVYVVAFGDEDVYLFTHLRRGQLQKIQQIVAEQSQQEGFNQDPEDALKEKVLQYCILWPRPLTMEFWKNSRAGIVDSLYQNVLMHSYVLAPQQTLMTAQL